MSKFTPGPWAVFAPQPGYLFVEVKGHTDRIACISDPRHHIAVSGETAKADARLIAAAPELYEALSELLDKEKLDDDDPRLGNARLMARAALAKANGA